MQSCLSTLPQILRVQECVAHYLSVSRHVQRLVAASHQGARHQESAQFGIQLLTGSRIAKSGARVWQYSQKPGMHVAWPRSGLALTSVCNAGANSSSHMQGCAVRLKDGLTGFIASLAADGTCEVQPWGRQGQADPIPGPRSVVRPQHYGVDSVRCLSMRLFITTPVERMACWPYSICRLAQAFTHGSCLGRASLDCTQHHTCI